MSNHNHWDEFVRYCLVFQKPETSSSPRWRSAKIEILGLTSMATKRALNASVTRAEALIHFYENIAGPGGVRRIDDLQREIDRLAAIRDRYQMMRENAAQLIADAKRKRDLIERRISEEHLEPKIRAAMKLRKKLLELEKELGVEV